MDMDFGNDKANRIWEKFLPNYKMNAKIVQQDLAQLLSDADRQAEIHASSSRSLNVKAAIDYIREQRNVFPYRLIYFIYSL